jgi:CheY-like chemotaxis protein
MMPVSILVVEDDAEIRDAVRSLLEDAGYLVHCAADPNEAMRVLERIPRPCILLWDALMPRHSLTMVDRATLDGVHVATLPVTIDAVRPLAPHGREPVKGLVCADAILNLVQEHCPQSAPAIAR